MLDVVAEELRGLVPVRRAAGGVQERDVVRVGELLRRRAGELAEADREHGACAARARAAVRCRGRWRARARRRARRRGSAVPAWWPPPPCRDPTSGRGTRRATAAPARGRGPSLGRAPVADAVLAREPATAASRTGGRRPPAGRRGGRRAARTAASCSGQSRASASRKCSRVPGPQVEDVRPDAAVAPASRAARTTSASCSGRPRCPAGSAPCRRRASMPASTSVCERAQPLPRRRGARLGRAPDLLVERRDREGDADSARAATPRRARRRRGRSSGRG